MIWDVYLVHSCLIATVPLIIDGPQGRSGFLRRPQNLKQSPTWFDVYLAIVKSSGWLFQILVAFSKCPNFKLKQSAFLNGILIEI